MLYATTINLHNTWRVNHKAVKINSICAWACLSAIFGELSYLNLNQQKNCVYDKKKKTKNKKIVLVNRLIYLGVTRILDGYL